MTETQATYQAESSNWRDDLNRLQREQLELARFYHIHSVDPNATNRTRMWTLIDNLAELLDACGTDAPVPQPVLKFHVLDVPYHSQHESDAKKYRRDCGPAAVEMVGEWYHPDTDITTDTIMTYITTGADRSVWIKELQKAALYCYGVTLGRHDGLDWNALRKYVVEDKRPAIVLVHYGSYRMRMDRNYTAGHYLVVVGFDEIQYQDQTIKRIIIHDPNFYGSIEAQGAFLPIVKPHFMKMWNDCRRDDNPRCMALIPVEEA